MWNLSYMENGEIKVKRFKSDKEADNWVNSKNNDVDFVPFNLGVWSELSQSFKTVYTYNEYQEWQEEIIMNKRNHLTGSKENLSVMTIDSNGKINALKSF